MPRMFAGCTKLEELDLTAFNTAACSDFTDMLAGCSSLITLKLGDMVLREGADYAIAYRNNVHVGTASASITGKGALVGGLVVVIGARAFAKAPKVKKLIIQSARLKKVKNCLKGSKVKQVEAKVYLPKSKRAKYKKMFTKKAGKRGVTFIYG